MARTAGLNLGTGWATVGIAFAATAAAALITPAAFRLTLRRWRWIRARDDTSRAHAAWREFHDDLADFGVTPRPSEPPRTLAARVTTTLPGPAAAAVTRLALAEERASYAARPTTSTAPAPRRHHRPPRTSRHRPPHHPLARHHLPRLHDHHPHPSRHPHPQDVTEAISWPQAATR